MLKIRQEQLDTLAKPKIDEFLAEQKLYLREAFEAESKDLDDETLESIIRFAMQRAKHHGFETFGQFQRWLALMFTFGYSFDTDPDYAWAGDALKASGTAEDKMRRLFDIALGYDALGKGLGEIPLD